MLVGVSHAMLGATLESTAPLGCDAGLGVSLAAGPCDAGLVAPLAAGITMKWDAELEALLSLSWPNLLTHDTPLQLQLHR